MTDDSLPTLVPSFQQLAEVIGQCEMTRSPLDLASRELDETDLALGDMLAAFEHSIPGQVLSSEEQDRAAEALDAFYGLRGMLGSLRVSISENDREAARRDLDAATGQMKVLDGALSALRKLESERPKLSGVPVVDHLLRVGQAVREQKAGWDTLAATLENLLPTWEAVVARETVAPEAVAHHHALEELFRVVTEQDAERLEAALEAVRVTGEALQVAQIQATALPEQATILCPRCGASIGEWDRTCTACGARLPERVAEQPASSVLPQTMDLPAYLQHLFQAAERLRAGEGAWEDFQSAVMDLRKRAEQSLTMLERIPPLPPGTPRDEREALHASQEALENGLEKFFEGLENLESLAANPDELALERGLEAVLVAVGETRGVATAWQRLVEGRVSSEPPEATTLS